MQSSHTYKENIVLKSKKYYFDLYNLIDIEIYIHIKFNDYKKIIMQISF